MVNIIFVTIV